MSEEKIFREKFAKAMTIVLWTAFAWGEVAGITHAFRQHGRDDGFSAIYTPPLAWWRSVELFWHTSQAASKPYPDLTTEELDVLSRLSAKAMEQPLTSADLDEYKGVAASYAKRTGRPVDHRELDLLLEAIRLPLAYNRELGRCLLHSIDNKQPFISIELQRLREQMTVAGARATKLEADFRRLESAAYGTIWTDEFGRQYHPLSRREVIEGLKRNEIAGDNFRKFAASVDELLR